MAEVDGKKRYILFSKEDGRPDSEKPCAFFASPAGCRNGAKCKFLHGAPEVKATKKQEVAQFTREEEPKEKKAKKEKKEKRESEPAPAPVPVYRQPAPVAAPVAQKAMPAPKPAPAPKPVPVVAVQSNPNDKIIQDLQRQLLEQQKFMEAQMKLLQQQVAAPVAAAAAVPVSAPVAPVSARKEKRKQSTVAATTPASNKSPKTTNMSAPVVALHQAYQPPVPAVQTGFGAMTGSIGQQSGAFSARAFNTLVNNNAAAAQESSDDTDSGDDENDFLFGAVNHVLSTGLQSSNNNTPYKQQEAAPSAASPFVSNQDAVKALHTSNSNHALNGSAKKNIFAAPKVAAAPAAAAAAPAPVRAPVVPFNPATVQLDSLAWQQLVVATQGHARFNANYTFQEEDSTWVKAKPYGSWCAQSNLPRVLSMDCEMCETTDPVTGVKVDNALVRFSVVDCTDNGNVLIDALVAPGLPITDARTHIHGITEQQLSGITWTLRHAQAALLGLCSDRTVFVGHSLHKDLRALKFNHRNVVDTAYLFTLEGEPGAAPSLRDVSEQILGTRLSDTHDSVEDARASLYAAAVLLTRGAQPTIVRRTSTSHSANAATGAAPTSAVTFSLLVHRIPDYCTEQHVQEMLVAHAQVLPTKILPITRGTGESSAVPSGKTTIFFSSQVHCDLAFDSIAGPNRPDKQNRSQKRVYFKGGGYICVRK